MEGQRSLRERLLGRRALFGLLQLYPNPALLAVVEQCGYDYLVLDAEHGVFSEADFARSLEVSTANEMPVLVRLAKHDPDAARRYLTLGAAGIIVPHVSTKQQAQAHIDVMANHANTALIVLLESALGAENAESILALERVDAAIVGPNDLTADLGCPGDSAHPAYTQALSRIERAAASSGKMLGTIPHGAYSLQVLHERGHRLFILGTDKSLLRESLSAQIGKAHSALKTN